MPEDNQRAQRPEGTAHKSLVKSTPTPALHQAQNHSY